MEETKPRRPIGRPAKPAAERRVNLAVRLPQALHTEIHWALRPGETRADLIEAAVRAELARRKGDG